MNTRKAIIYIADQKKGVPKGYSYFELEAKDPTTLRRMLEKVLAEEAKTALDKSAPSFVREAAAELVIEGLEILK